MAKSYTYDNPIRREDLINVITEVSPTDTQLYTGLAKVSASNTLHEWPTDVLNSVGDNAAVEGADATFAARNNPTRVANICQIITKDFDVTGTEREVDHAGFTDRYAREMSKAAREWKHDAEYALMRGSQASGSGSGARRMKGIKNAITTNKTSQSGVSLSENILNDLLELTWQQGGEVDELYVGSKLKRRISGFTAGSTKNVDAEDKRLVNSVDIYESDFGLHKIFKHRYVTVSGDTNYDIVGIQSDKFRVAHLRSPFHEKLAKTGDSDKGMIVGELTLEYLAEKTSFLGLAYL